jgi:hypothetical protein
MKGLGFFPNWGPLLISKLSWAQQVIGPNKSTGFYILPQAGHKAAATYIKDRENTHAKL